MDTYADVLCMGTRTRVSGQREGKPRKEGEEEERLALAASGGESGGDATSAATGRRMQRAASVRPHTHPHSQGQLLPNNSPLSLAQQ